MAFVRALDVVEFLAIEGVEVPVDVRSIELTIQRDAVVSISYTRDGVVEKELVTLDMLAALARALGRWSEELARSRG